MNEDFARHPLFFAGCTWADASEWNDSSDWAGAYPDDLSGLDPGELGQPALNISYGCVNIVCLMATEGKSPGDAPRRVLDAGCGLSNLPYVLARMGDDVTAVDFAETATRLNQALHERRLALPLSDHVVASLEERKVPIGASAGRVAHRTLDWFDDRLEPGSFDIIYANNALRLSRKPYWRRSLQRFHELLAPDGLLIVLNHNAVAVCCEVVELASTAGFYLVDEQRCVEPAPEHPREPGQKKFVGLWPTG